MSSGALPQWKFGTTARSIGVLSKGELLQMLDMYPDGLVVTGAATDLISLFNSRQKFLCLEKERGMLIHMGKVFVEFGMEHHQRTVLVHIPDRDDIDCTGCFILFISVQRGQNMMERLARVGWHALEYAQTAAAKQSCSTSVHTMMQSAFQGMLASRSIH